MREWVFWREAPKKSRNPFKPAISSLGSRLEQVPREKIVLRDMGNNQSCRQQGKTRSTKAALGQARLFSTQLPFHSGGCSAGFSLYVLDFPINIGVIFGMWFFFLTFLLLSILRVSGIEMFVWIRNCLSLVFVQKLQSLPLFILLFANFKDLKHL